MKRRLPDDLDDDVRAEIARLEIERYDTRMFAIHNNSTVMVGLGLIGLAFWYFREIGPFAYTGGAGIWPASFALIVSGIAYFIVEDRKNREAID